MKSILPLKRRGPVFCNGYRGDAAKGASARGALAGDWILAGIKRGRGRGTEGDWADRRSADAGRHRTSSAHGFGVGPAMTARA